MDEIADGDESYVPTSEDGKQSSAKATTDGDIDTFLLMEDISDKLKLLDYEKHFCKERGSLKPVARTYFAMSAANPNEQFFYFTSLVAWLASLLGHSFKPLGQFDDPNAAAATVVDELKKMGLSTDFPPLKLKQGYGVAVCAVLNSLLDRVLQYRNIQLKKPVHSTTAMDDVDDAEESEMVADVVDETIDEEKDDDVEEEEYSGVQIATKDEGPSIQVIKETTIDPAQWKLEVERVTPLLKVHVVVDPKDWRTHVDQMKQYHGAIGNGVDGMIGQLEKLVKEVDSTLEKISAREKLLNNQFDHVLREYKLVQEQYLAHKEKYKQSSENVTNLQNDLNALSEELESVRMQMDSRSTDMTDTAPVVNLKKAMSKLKEEIVQMEVRSGVIEHTLLQAKFKSKQYAALQGDNEKRLNTRALGITVEYE